MSGSFFQGDQNSNRHISAQVMLMDTTDESAVFAR